MPSAAPAARHFPGALDKLGAQSVLDQGYANQSQDFTPVVLAIKQSGADVLGSYFTFENDLGIFARQLRQLGVNIPWVGSAAIVDPTAVKLAGPALFGTYGVADYAQDSSDATKAFAKAYYDMYKIVADSQGSWTIRCSQHPLERDQGRQFDRARKIREAILATRKFAGAEGEYNFDQNGDGLRGYNIVRNEKGQYRFRPAYRVRRLDRC